MRMSTYTIPLKIEEDRYLLINARTGAVTLVDEHVVKLLQKELSEVSADPSLITLLKEGGHLTALSPDEEAEEISHLYEKYVETHRRVYTHMVIPTYDCNLKCSYCPLSHLYDSTDESQHTVIDDKHIDALVTAAAQIDGPHKGQMILFGGEPLLVEKPVIERILHKGSLHGYSFITATNGTFIHDFIDILQKYDVTLEIPIDGPQHIHDARRIKKDGTGTFEEVVQGVDTVLDAGLTIFLRVNLDKGNVASLPQLTDFFQKKGWYDNPKVFIHLSPVFENSCRRNEPFTLRKTFYHDFIFHITKNVEAAASFFDIRGIEMVGNALLQGDLGPPRFWYCEANSGVLIYDPFGDIYVCTGHMGDESTRIGRYYPELSWNTTYTSWKERLVFNIPECNPCKYALLCGGGCGYEALEKYGILSKPVCYDYRGLAKAISPLYKALKNE